MMMKKLIITIMSTIVALSVFGQTSTTDFAVYSEAGTVMVDSVAEKLAKGPSSWNDCWKHFQGVKKEDTYTFAEVKELLEKNKGKEVITLCKSINGVDSISYVMFACDFYDDEIKALTNEQAIEFYKQTANTRFLIVKNILTKETAFNKSLKGLKNLRIWDIRTMAHIQAGDRTAYDDIFFTTKLATGEYSKDYQNWFKEHVRTQSLNKAKEIVSNELRALLSKIDPTNKKQNEWLTTVRILNTSYSEL